MGALQFCTPVAALLSLHQTGALPAKGEAPKIKELRHQEAFIDLPDPEVPSPFTVLRPDGTSDVYPLTENATQTETGVMAYLAELDRDRFSPEEILIDLEQRFHDPGTDLARGVVYDPNEDASMLAASMLLGACEFLPEVTTAAFRRGAVPVLRDALNDPTVQDQRKLIIGPLMAGFGCEVDDEEYFGSFSNFEEAQHEFAENAPEIPPIPWDVTRMLCTSGLPLNQEEPLDIGDDLWPAVFGVITSMLEKNPAAAAMALCESGSSAVKLSAPDNEQLLHLFTLLVETAPDDAAVRWQLTTFADWPLAGAYGEAARNAASRMRGRGQDRGRSPFRPTFSRGYLSMVDGSGARQLSLFFTTPEGEAEAVLFMVRDWEGLADTFILRDGLEHTEAIFNGPGSDLCCAPCSLDLALEVLGDALALSVETGTPLPLNAWLCRQYLGEETLTPARRMPDVSAYRLESIDPTRSAVEGSEDLLESRSFADHWFASDDAYAFLEKHFKGKRMTLNGKRRAEFLSQICIRERPQLLRRMRANLEVEALAGRDDAPMNRLAARTYRVLSTEAVSFDEIPYVQALAEHSIEVIRQNLRNGLTCQAEANAFYANADEGWDDEDQGGLFDFLDTDDGLPF
jgi:hypothetical protein